MEWMDPLESDGKDGVKEVLLEPILVCEQWGELAARRSGLGAMEVDMTADTDFRGKDADEGRVYVQIATESR
jgi:hypothetical protein